jgi:hypothetical protein
MPWDDEFETWSMYLHQRVPASRADTFFPPGEWQIDRISELLKPHLGKLSFEVVEEPVPSGVGYLLKTREWLQASIDRDWLKEPGTRSARFLRGYIDWLRRRADELEKENAELLSESPKPD